jgi:hypothetical protein
MQLTAGAFFYAYQNLFLELHSAPSLNNFTLIIEPARKQGRIVIKREPRVVLDAVLNP